MAQLGDPSQIPQAELLGAEQSLTPGAVEYSPENSTTPGAVPTADATAEQLAALSQDPTAVPDDFNRLKERAAFESYVQNQGETIPPNFKDAGAWFDSLKEAQKNYTQGQQDIADLKRTYAENDTVNPNYQAPVETPPEAPQPVTDGVNPELRIPNPSEIQEVEAESHAQPALSEEQWQAWGMEIAVKGDLTPETREEIKQAGFTDRMVDDFLGAQKARMREAYGDAATVVGGKDKLDNLFKWAAESLSYEEQVQINVGLSSPAYEVTLRGLNDMYNTRSNKTAKANEPASLQNRQPVADTQAGYVAYSTKREFYADRNNPRFKTDKAFRAAVEQRMVRTDYNRLPN